jgi:eukaryotic-like serine/threonine-protein kinase
VKVIAPPRGRVASQTAIARFHTEVELNVSLRLPNLPDFYDAELLGDGTAVLVLEYLDGTDLAGLFRQTKPLSVPDALFVVSEVFRTLQVLHTRGVHRDIKPSNIFIRRKPRLDSEGRVEKRRVTLLDFGIAKLELAPELTEQNTVIGTRCYMSPEQLRGRPVDTRSDIYSAGAVLYEMLGGHPPFVPDPRNVPSLGELAVRHASQPLEDLRPMGLIRFLGHRTRGGYDGSKDAKWIGREGLEEAEARAA